MVYVLDIQGNPLMPMEQHGKVRRFLRDGRAHVVRLMPFTIQLNYESTIYKQPVSLGIDAGTKHVGVSATTEKKELFTAQVELRDDIVKKLADRRELRVGRRHRKTRYRKPRFNNRANASRKGRLMPSVRNKVDTHLKVIRLVHNILPVSKTTIEVGQFDIQKIKNPDVQGTEYQQGEQMGFWNVREYVLVRDGYKCQNCKGRSGDPVLNVHHIESRRTGGDAPNNLITLCETCHKAYHRGEIKLKVKRGTSLRDAAVMNTIRWTVYEKVKTEFANVHLTYGYITKRTRIGNGIEKTHVSDAFCVSGNVKTERLGTYLKCRCIPRHTRSLHVCKPAKHGIRRSAVASHWIGKSRLQRYDYVEWNGKYGFISGSSHGRPILRDIDGTLITPTASVNAKAVRFINRNKGFLMQVLTCET